MTHPLVEQLKFSRREFRRGLGDVSGQAAQQRLGQMNCISWMVGHLAWQEQQYWLERAQGQILIPELNKKLAYGQPACTPPAEEMWQAWNIVTQAADVWLDTLTPERLQAPLTSGYSSAGTFMFRTIYHYWYHLGEGMAVRQLLGHAGLPDFVGDIDNQAPYRPDQGDSHAEKMDKSTLIKLVTESRLNLDQLIAQFDTEAMLRPGLCGEWSLKDVTAHITWHEREMIGVLRARALQGSDLWGLPLDQRNQAIFEQLQGLSLERVRVEAAQVHQQLCEEIQKLDEEDLHNPGRFNQFPPDWLPWELLAENTYRHYQDHLPALKDWRANKSSDQQD
jgi:hypothetical protein